MNIVKLLVIGIVGLSAVSVRADRWIDPDEWTDPDAGYTLTYDIGAAQFSPDGNGAYFPVTITSISFDAVEHSAEKTGAVVIPASISRRSGSGDYCPVRCIGDGAFRDCAEMTSVTIPSSVKRIERYAFSGCSGLTSVTIPDSVEYIGEYAFSDCSRLTSVVFGEEVSNPGYQAFFNCSNLKICTVGIRNAYLKSVNGMLLSKDEETLVLAVNGNAAIPSTVKTIGSQAFQCCSGMSRVTIPNSVTRIAAGAFRDCSWFTGELSIPDSVTSIGESAFSGCSGLTSVTIPDSVTSIGNYAFYGCSGLTSVTIPGSLTCIPTEAFRGCRGLMSVTICDGVTSIGSDAFHGCSNLTSVTIPDGVTEIGSRAFWGCGGLTSVTIPDSVTTIGGFAFHGCGGLKGVTIGNGVTSIGAGAFRDCGGLTSMTIPDSVTSIWGGAFEGCSGLRSVTIPDGVTEIGDGAFLGCSSLTSVKIPNNVTSIDWGTFANCSGLTSVTISDSVTSIGERAFSRCSGLTSVTIPGSVTNIERYAFQNCSGLTCVKMMGDCPRLGLDSFEYVNSSAVAYLPRAYSTYKVSSGRWAGMKVEYYDPDPIIITFNANGGDGGWSRVMDFKEVLKAPVVTRNWFTFVEWSPEVPQAVPWKSATYTAQWQRYGDSISASAMAGKTMRQLYPEDYADMTTVELEEGVAKLPTGFFDGCDSIESLTWAPTMSEIGIDDLPSKIRGALSYDEKGFMTYNGWLLGCRNQDAMMVAIPEGVIGIGLSAFSTCSGLKIVHVKEGDAERIKALMTKSGFDVSRVEFLEGAWIFFSAEGGRIDEISRKVNVGGAFGELPEPVRQGYSFEGWWTAKNGGRQISGSTALVGDEEYGLYYAHWKPRQYSVTLDSNGGTSGTASVLATFGDAMPSITLPKRQGYRFGGYWSGRNGEGAQYYTETGMSAQEWDIAGERVLYAHWIEGAEFSSDVQYCVILLSPGANASSYPVAYMAAPPMGGFNTDDYKTTKLVLKLIEPGEFKMGGSYDVTLTKPFYCGLFEVTQKQYELVMGSNPSSSTGGMRPVENVTWKMIRGDSSTYNWPNVTGVNPSSFVGRLQARTGLNFDLPTEAQWEYACRAGTTSTYNNGGSSEADLKKLGRYSGNANDGKGGYSNGHTVVGSYEANRWGLYDMHGNVYEWCLDWYGNLAGGVTDPAGPASASKRVERGGGWGSRDISYCSSTYRLGDYPSSAYNDCGFRLARSGTESYNIVKFDVNGGTMAATNVIRFVAPGAPIGTLPTPKLSGYAFDGWWTEATGGTKITAATTIAGGATYYAHWAKIYTVTFNPSGGSLDSASKTRSVKNGSSVGSLPNPTRTGYAFAGWWTSASGGVQISASTIVTGDLTCYAHWLANKYAVTFDANGGGVNESNRSVTFGSVVGELPTPTRTGYAFKGWWTSATGGTQISASTVVAGDMALYAHWTPIYTVTFDANGGSVDESNRGVESGSAVGTLPTASRTGYSFAGWWTTASGGVQISASTKITEAVTYYAHWSCAVTFNANGGSVNESSRRVVSGSAVGLLPTPARSGYIFDGWFTETSGGARISPSAIISCPVTYYAHWTWTDKPILTIDSTGALTAVDLNGNTDVVIPDGVTRIESFAFKGCYNLTSVTIPDSVMRIGASAFYGCGALEKISLPFVGARRGNTGDDDSFFGYIFGPSPYTGGTSTTQYDGSCSARYYIPSNLRSVAVTDENILGAGVFYGCKGLTSVMIPNSVTSIGVCAFYGCSGLASLTIPNSVISIGEYAFDGCSGFTSVTIPDSVTSIGDSAFGYCSGLTSVTIPDSVTSFGFNVFSGCSGIREVVVPQYLCTNGLGMLFPQHQSITNVFISDSVTSIGEAAFYGYSGLASVTIPSGVTNIGNSAFYSCSGLASVTIPNSVTSIGDRAFGYCSGLTSVTIPDSVTSIGSYAFSGCSGLTSVYVAFGYADRVKELMRSSGFDVTKISFIELGAAYIVFNANGGGVAEQSRKVAVDDQVGELPTPTRTGHTFTGWFTAANGGTAVSASTVVTEIVTYYAHWTVNKYTVTFDANGGAGGKTVTQNYGTALAAPTVTRTGYMFAGWSPAAPAKVPAGNATYVAQWTKDKYTVTFNANGGAGGWSRSMDYGAAIAAPTVTRAGYTFAGWSPAVSKTVPIGGACYTAQWTINRHQIRLALNGGEGVGSVTVDYGTRVGDLPVPTRDGYEFLGWFTAPRGGSRIADNAIVTGDMTLYAQWHTVLLELYELIDGAAPAAAASEYNGYLYDEKSGAVKGTIQVKVGKPNAKTGLATIKATVVVGTKKVTLKGVEKGKSVLSSDGPTELALVGGESCEIVLGAEGISGYYGEYVIDGSRNFFTSKDKAEQRAVNDVLAKWLGSFMVIWDGGSLSVSIAAKGKVKVSGTLADGKTKVSASTVLLVGEEWSCVSVTAQKANLTFVLWLSHDGKTIEAEGLGDNVLVGLPGTLANGAAFQIDADEFAAVFGQTMLPYLPDGVPVTQKGTKWTLPKAGKVVYKNGAPDESKLGDNPCGLKLTYKSKDGTFKGSFKVYAEVKGKPKATTVNVTGFMLNGIGYGTATIKKVGSVPILIE